MTSKGFRVVMGAMLLAAAGASRRKGAVDRAGRGTSATVARQAGTFRLAAAWVEF
jgi:hypothetical protein